MGSYQNSGRVRFLRRKAPRSTWNSPPEIRCLKHPPRQGEPNRQKIHSIMCLRKFLCNFRSVYADEWTLSFTGIKGASGPNGSAAVGWRAAAVKRHSRSSANRIVITRIRNRVRKPGCHRDRHRVGIGHTPAIRHGQGENIGSRQSQAATPTMIEQSKNRRSERSGS